MSDSILSLQDVAIEATTEVTFLVKSNPKREGSKAHSRFARYIGTSTVEDYLEAGGTKGDLRYDWEKGFIDLAGVEREE